MSGGLLDSLLSVSDLRTRPPNPVACIGAYIGPMDAKNSCWEIQSTLRLQCQDQIYTEIQKHLEDHFGSVPGEDRITISFYMIGKSPRAAAPTVLFISENPDYRKNARKAIKTSKILSQYPGFKTAHSSKDPGFQKMEQLASNNNSALGFEFPGSDLDAWLRQPASDIHNRLVHFDHNFDYEEETSRKFQHANSTASANWLIQPSLRSPFHSDMDEKSSPAFQDIKPSALTLELGAVSPGLKSATEVWYNGAMSIKPVGMALHVQHPSGTRTATANVIKIKDRLYFQTALHPFFEKSPGGLETHDDDDDAFEIDSDTASDNETDDLVDASIAMTSVGSRTPDSVTRSLELESDNSLSSSGADRIQGGSTASSKAGSEPFDEDPEKFDAFSTTQSAFEPQIPVTPPPPTSLFWLGKLVAASIDKDWALISIDSPIVETTLSANKDRVLSVEKFARTPRDDVIVKMTTASHGSLTGLLSAWPSYTRLSHSKTIRKVYVVRFDGFLTDGDCGSVVVDVGNEEIYGHMVAGCRTTGSAYVLAASETVKDIQEFSAQEQLRSDHHLNTLKAAYSRHSRSGSSMAPALIHQSSSSFDPPSLISSYPEAMPTETSISTGLDNRFSGIPLLEENNGVLEQPTSHEPITPVYECVFWFLNCGYISQNQDEWMIHCHSHFRGEEPPQSVECPLCEWKIILEDGQESWDARMRHLAHEHTMLGQTLRGSRPDFRLFQHLWSKRLIDDQDLKELKGGNHHLGQPPGNFVATNGRRARVRRRQRRQHVSSTRS